MPPVNKRIAKINRFTQAHLIKLLLDGTYNCQELAEETGLHYVTVLDYTRELHRVGAAYIDHWEKDSRGRDVIKVYKLGVGKDAKRHVRSAVERQRAYRAKKKQMTMTQLITGATYA